MSKYGVFSGPYFPAFGLSTERYFNPNAGKHRPEKSPYLDTFHAVKLTKNSILIVWQGSECASDLLFHSFYTGFS